MDSAASDVGQLDGRELSLAFERLVRLTREVASASDISPTSAAVLSRLRRLGPQRLTELARSEGVSQPAMTQLVTRMEREHLLVRRTSADDRRGVDVEISDRGRAVLDERRAQRAEGLGRLLDRLSSQDRAAIAAALPALDRLVDGAIEG